LKGALERVGYRVVSTTDGAGALARIGPHPPDVIVLAGAVPDLDLLDLCMAVRHDLAGQKTPCVLVADAAGSAVVRCRVRARISCSRRLSARSRLPRVSVPSSRRLVTVNAARDRRCGETGRIGLIRMTATESGRLENTGVVE
jgi:CheY-like chemotaxis protein